MREKCFLCKGDLADNPEDSYCFGCRKFICGMHATIFGRHKPEDHDEDDE